MLILDNSLLIGKGSDRACYQHPDDKNICIKIKYSSRKRDENKREYEYYKKYFKRNIDIPIARPLSWVKTNKGVGLEYQLIRDYTGEISPTLLDVLNKKKVDYQLLSNSIDVFIDKLIENNVSVTDLQLQNICFRTNSDGSCDIIMIDGYGFSNFINLGKLHPYFIKAQTKRRVDRAFLRFKSIKW